MSLLAENEIDKTYTLEQFISMQSQDETTYKNFSIVHYRLNALFTEQCLLDYYMSELKAVCSKVTSFTVKDIDRYRYFPDILAYDLYGNVQLDYIVMLCNGMIDPKEFDFSRSVLYLPTKAVLNEFLSEIYNSEQTWRRINNDDLKREMAENS